MTRRERRTLWLGLAFISPWIIGFLGLAMYPVVASAYYSLCDYDVLSRPVWVGTLNYRDMVTDSVFWKSLYNTAYYTVFSVPLGLILALLVAVLLNQAVLARSVFRTLYFLPAIVPLVAVAMIWLWIFNGSLGLLNYSLSLVGIDGPNWLADEAWTKPTLILATLWQIGPTMVIFLASLQDVPIVLYEAADVEGAGPVRKFWHITVPMVSPVIYFNLIIGMIGALQAFVTPYVMMGGGGPNRSALFYAVYLYQNAFSYNQMGYACAMAWVLFVLIVLLTIAATRLMRRHIYYAGE
jgi:multiple sugar transport system permease protein